LKLPLVLIKLALNEQVKIKLVRGGGGGGGGNLDEAQAFLNY